MADDAAGKEVRGPVAVAYLGHWVVRKLVVVRNAVAAAEVAVVAAAPGWNAVKGVELDAMLDGALDAEKGAGQDAGFGSERCVAGQGAVLGVAGQDVAAADQGVG